MASLAVLLKDRPYVSVIADLGLLFVLWGRFRATEGEEAQSDCGEDGDHGSATTHRQDLSQAVCGLLVG
jgi:hypothetical protein